MLKVLDQLPEGLLEIDAEELDDLLGGPTLIHLEGEVTPPLFISVLQHGNEFTGFEALKRLLETYRDGEDFRAFPRALSIFIANTKGAKVKARSLVGQVDYNRVWPGADTSGAPEHAMMAEVYEDMKARGVFASVDIHNNTGLNPHYGCVTNLEPQSVQLASMFSSNVVYYQVPRGTQAKAFSGICPSVVLECGKPGEKGSVSHASEFLSVLFGLKTIPVAPLGHHDADIMHTVAKITVVDGVKIGFGEGFDVCFEKNLDVHNYKKLDEPLLFLTHSDAIGLPLVAKNEDGDDVFDDYFIQQGNQVFMKAGAIPSMLTMDTDVMQTDCVCYMMEEYPLPD